MPTAHSTEKCLVELGFTSIYDVMGQRVRTLADRGFTAGSRSLIWDLKDDRGFPLPSGVYLYRAVAGDQVVKDKVVLVR